MLVVLGEVTRVQIYYGHVRHISIDQTSQLSWLEEGWLYLCGLFRLSTSCCLREGVATAKVTCGAANSNKSEVRCWAYCF